MELDARRADAADDIAEVADVEEGFGRLLAQQGGAHRQRCGHRGSGALTHPGVQVPQRRPQHETLLAAVHRIGAAQVLLERTHLMQVGVRRTGHLPRADQIRIRLAGTVVAEVGEQIGFGLHREHRHPHTRVDRCRRTPEGVGDIDTRTHRTQREAGERAGMDQETVEHAVRRGRTY